MLKHKKIYIMPMVGFLAMILVTTLCLQLPTCNQEQLSSIDALFEATSAVTATGSSVKDLSQQFTFWGQLVLLIAMEIGAVGFMMFFSVLFMITKKKIKLSNTLFLSNEVSTNNYRTIQAKTKKILQYTIIIELMGTWFLLFRFIPIYGLKQGIWYSIFHAVSAFCNAGLDIVGSESLILFQDDIYVNCVFFILMFLGSLGFFVLEDLIGWFCTGRKSKIHVESKLVLTVSLLIIGTGTILLRIFDANLSILQTIFCVLTARNTGLSTVKMSDLSQMGQFLISMIMFIGGGPGSNAGGIRVMVFAILILTAVANLRNREEVVIFYRKIEDKTIKKAITIFLVDLGIVWLGMMAMVITDRKSLLDTLFYIVSTFSNTGLATIDVGQLTFLGKCISILIMYIGKIAPISLVSLFMPMHHKESGIQYSSMDVIL